MATQLPSGSNKDVLIEPRETLSEEALISILRRCQLKITNQRLAILRVFNSGARVHMTAQDILDEVRKTFPRIGFATVYRFLRELTEKGITAEISMGNASSLYELKFKHPHYHIACTSCGKIVEFKNKIIEDTLKKIVKERKFTLKNQVVELYVCCNSEDCK